MNFLYAAYISTWVIHVAYLVHLARRYSKLRDEIQSMKKK